MEESVIETNGVIPPLKSRRDAGTDIGKENLWSEILGEVQKQGNTKLPANKSVLVLGDNASGKTTLIAKLQGVEDPKKGFGLEYAYIDVRDEYRDDMTRLGVWVLDGEPGHANLLKFALNEANYENTLVILTVSMNTPWAWMDQCHHWMKILADHVDKFKWEVASEDQQQPRNHRTVARERLTHLWQNYCETLDDLEATSPMKRSTAAVGGPAGSVNGVAAGSINNSSGLGMNRLASMDEIDVDPLPLPEGALTTNLGLDIVVVVTKTDYMTTLEKEYDYRDEHFDFMQQWIRRFCLAHGASLFYTSVKEDKNCDLLYKYLTHRIYGLPFRTPALVVEKDAVLIPAGWDNLKKISILYENMHSCKPEDYYTDIITAPTSSRKAQTNREADVQTEDEQSFLHRQQQALQQSGGIGGGGGGVGGQAPARGESPMRSQTGSKSSAVPRTPGQVGQGSPKIDAKQTPGQPGAERVLANFFNSLLHKKSGTPGGGGGSPNTSLDGSNALSSPRASSASRTPNGGEGSGGGGGLTPGERMRTDAAAELDRLSRSVKKEIDFSSQAQSDC